MTVLEVESLSKSFLAHSGERVTAIQELTFDVAAGEFVCIVGPSGCGKTTLLKCVSGLMAPSQGVVRVRGAVVDGTPDELAVVFQDYSRSLLPWMSVEQNIQLPLRYKGLSRSEIDRLTGEAINAVGLGEFEAHYPWQLSGGMQQRVAIARAIAYEPSILLMDEPFASVDAQTRTDLEDLLLDIWRRFEITVLFVTHDIDESVYLADRVLVLDRRPTSIRTVVEVPLERPRDQLKTKADPAYADLRSQVFRAIRRQEEGFEDR